MFSACLLTLALSAPSTTVFPLDPVEVSFGREVSGSEAITRSRGRYTYRFASEDTARVFDAEPERYEIQLGGACARMGSLSGIGTPEIFTVYRGKLYLFASEGCRSGFLENPEALLPRADPKPEPSEDQLREGRRLLAKAVQAMGGREALRALESIRWVDRKTYGSGEDAVVGLRELHFDFEGNVSLLRSYPEWNWAGHVRGDTGLLVEGGESFPMIEAQRRAVLAELHGIPVWLLRQRNDPDFLAFADGADLVCHLRGFTTRLILNDAAEVIAVERIERGPSLAFELVRSTFEAPAILDQVKTMVAHRASVKGKPYEAGSRQWEDIQLNQALPRLPE